MLLWLRYRQPVFKSQSTLKEVPPMPGLPIQDLYALITVTDLDAQRRFWTGHLGFAAGFDSRWFLWLTRPVPEGGRGLSLGFMSADHPTRPPGPEVFTGLGMILTLDVTDAAAHFAALTAEGVPVVHTLTDEAWGQRRFTIRDPAGILVDIVEAIESAAGFWDRYLVA
jgi:catechol 2,3-dioxygenase-like lactoylglutathione lyase family enzyme